MCYSFTVVHRTEVVKKNLNPQWQPFTVKARVLCAGDFDRSVSAGFHVECGLCFCLVIY